MSYPKKHFGQHFLRDQNITRRIADSLQGIGTQYHQLMEIGPGQGVLTQFLYERYGKALHLVEIDDDLIPHLHRRFPELGDNIHHIDFLEAPLEEYMGKEPFGLIGNFPYNISSQILFRLVEYRRQIPECVGMFQKEVAQRVVSGPGTKDYGLLSVWLQTFYEGKYLFTVEPGSFFPPPKVKSGVIRLARREDLALPCKPETLLTMLRSAFQQRRKTLRNSLSTWKDCFGTFPVGLLEKRPEQLPPADFHAMAAAVEKCRG